MTIITKNVILLFLLLSIYIPANAQVKSLPAPTVLKLNEKFYLEIAFILFSIDLLLIGLLIWLKRKYEREKTLIPFSSDIETTRRVF